MTTKIILIVVGSIAAVALVFVLGRLADGKSGEADKKGVEQKN